MSGPHRVTVEELAEYIEQKRSMWERFASSADTKGSLKTLEFNGAGLYRVTSQKRDIYIGALKETAVREYNNAL